MTTIVTLKSGAYAIYDNEGVKIVQCNEPINTFNDVVKNIGIDIENVQIIDADSFPDVLSDQYITDVPIGESFEGALSHLDNVINKVNASMSGDYDAEIQMYEDMGILNSQKDDCQFEEVEMCTNTNTNTPVGSVEMPNIGDLVYVEGIRGVLRVITGGIGTVSMIHKEDEDTIEYDEDTDEETTVTSSNLLIELEEIPGQYFSWCDLRYSQDELENKYGYKPASMV